MKRFPQILIACGLLGAGFFAGNAMYREPAPAPKKAVEVKLARPVLTPFAKVVKVSKFRESDIGTYPNALIAVRCEGADGEFVAFVPLLVDHVQTDAARIEVGMELKLSGAVEFDAAPARVQEQQAVNSVGGITDRWVWVPRWESEGLRGADLPPVFAALAAQRSFLVKAEDSEFYFFAGGREVYQPAFYYPGKKGGVTKITKEIARFAKQLGERGTKLFFVVAPQSSSIFPDLATGLPYDIEGDGTANFQVTEALAAIGGEGFQAVDLVPPFVGARWAEHAGVRYPICLPNDTHWSPRGAKLAAEVLAEQIQGNRPAGADGFFREEVEIVSVEGDVRNLGEARHLKLKIPAVETPATRVLAVGEEHSAWLRLDDPASAIHVLGDSSVDTARIFGSSFSEHLVRALGQPVFEVSVGGGGPSGARQKWVKDGGFEHAEVVVWVVAERYMGFPWLWEKVDLPEL